MILVKSDIVLDTIEPYLKALQSVEPFDIPFAKYLQLQAHLTDIQIDLPSYARVPGFRWKLDHLVKSGPDRPPIAFDPKIPEQVQTTRILLKEHGVLDGSQATRSWIYLRKRLRWFKGKFELPASIYVTRLTVCIDLLGPANLSPGSN